MIEKESKRIDYFDVLKIIAPFFVIILHVSANNIIRKDLFSLDWNILNIYDSISRWTVPCFVMMSGSIFLRANYSIADILKKYVLKLIIVYFVWSFIYTLLIYNPNNIMDFINYCISGFYHMWYIPMIIGLYMLTPILRKIVNDKKIFKYFLIICFIFSVLIPTLLNIIKLFDSSVLFSFSNSFKELIGNINFKFGYICYFMIGYYINENEIPKKNRKNIYLFGLICLVSTFILTYFSSSIFGTFNQSFYDNFSINVFITSIALFVFAKYNFKSNNILMRLSTCSLGIYIVHVLLIEKFGLIFHFNVNSFCSILSVLVVSIIVYVVSLIIVLIIKHIPILKKFII